VTEYRPLVANPQSKHKTATSLQFELHYAKLGIIARWDWDRYCRLASFLNITLYELASLINWTHRGVEVAKENNRFPSPVCLLLTLLEAQVMHMYTDDIVKNPFPNGS
jgi:hypothetical protein